MNSLNEREDAFVLQREFDIDYDKALEIVDYFKDKFIEAERNYEVGLVEEYNEGHKDGCMEEKGGS